MVDGVHFGEHTCVVALGIDIDGAKHPLSLVEGSTENATLVTELIVGLRERGLDVTRPILAVLDGSKALRRAVLDVFDRPVIGRCQLHKIRNVARSAPGEAALRGRRPDAAGLSRRLRAGRRGRAERAGRRAGPTHPGAAASLREGMAETLTVLRLDIPPTLARTLRSTNAVESMISICRTHASNVKTLARRADGAALVRRRHGRGRQAVPPRQRPHAPAVAARHARRRSPNLSVPPVIMRPSPPPDDHRAATEVPRNSGHPRSGTHAFRGETVGRCRERLREVVYVVGSALTGSRLGQRMPTSPVGLAMGRASVR